MQKHLLVFMFFTRQFRWQLLSAPQAYRDVCRRSILAAVIKDLSDQEAGSRKEMEALMLPVCVKKLKVWIEPEQNTG